MKPANRGANGRGGSRWIRPEKRLAIYHRDDFTCLYCLRTSEETLLSLDHVVPRARGGTNDVDNLITSCFTCNSSQRGEGPLSMATRTRITLATARPIDIRRGKEILAAKRRQSTEERPF